ncbi:MAG: S-layer homology domain-containing protein, partial [Actinomycetota bacterium]|nr:S-layer homology domain-containing protein [Actinomycetota bacterium]
TLYCPASPVTRGQMATFLSRARGLPPPTADYFADDAGSPYESSDNQVKEAGISNGCSATAFCPNAPTTREQMASFLVRALQLPASTFDYFGDDEGSIHEADINALAQAGITSGCTATTYCPGASVTREQMAAFLHRALAPT